jgi:hypothetical protein
MSCDDVAYNLQDLNIEFSGENETFIITIPSTVYLNIAGDSICECLISESPDNQQAFILGDPFFRNNIISFDYANHTMNLFSKTSNTPIIPNTNPPDPPIPTPTPDVTPTEDNALSGGAIFGIVVAVLVVAGVAIAGCYFYNKPKASRTNSGNFNVEDRDENANLLRSVVSDTNYNNLNDSSKPNPDSTPGSAFE